MLDSYHAAYDKNIKEKEITDKQDTKNIYSRLASEMMFGGPEGVDRIINEGLDMGIPYSRLMKNAREWDRKMDSPEYAQRDRVGRAGREEAEKLNEEFDPLINP